jgi:hypothetical protein
MKLVQIKRTIAASYVVGMVCTGLAAGVSSPAGWVAVTALALLPAGALLTLWGDPADTMSEAIQAARR